MSQPILSVEKLVAGYGKFSAIKNVDFQVYEGETVAIVGPNGAGKTTFLETIAGTIRPQAGQIFFQGRQITHLSELGRRKLGLMLVPQDSYIFPGMSVKDNLDVAGILNPKKAIGPLLDYVYHLFPVLEERGRQLADTLSGGQRKMLAAGIGIVADAKVLLFDEPSIGLAPKLVTRLFEDLSRIKKDKGKTLILAEQNIKILNIADRIFGLEAGECVFFEERERLDQEQVRRLFLGG